MKEEEEENSISIVNRTNSKLTGENPAALPVKFVNNYAWIKMFLAGFLSAIILLAILIFYFKQQITQVQPSDKNINLQNLQVQ